MKFDHVAICVSSIIPAIERYEENLGATVEYSDMTWAMLNIGGQKLALTLPDTHPPHVAFIVNSLNDFPDGCEIKMHRDGSYYTYQRDLFGNVIELIMYP